ncbi:nickel-dependent hydrogenase large subunit [Aneurinibacillus terranovensis]|uniref:nickel-dependent hydrogenase large subunit n=1 Tax=Aneurinibacillus terranovensis TaxID=278991 RepID=UPI0003FCB098|nr:nickel-dependent hydrogenase large subunit [Aneurinibacillus terranovensis]
MSKRIVVDPITRIEGHLRIEAEMDQGKIIGAYSSGTMVRGLELVLKGRDPRDAWALAQRICGVCTTTHSLAALRSVEDALKYEIPKNANYIRNIMNAVIYVHDHIVHFYHLHALDWVDVASALKADPAAASAAAQKMSNWSKSSPGYFKELQNKLKRVVESGQLSIFTNGYWGHPLYKLPSEVNLILLAHYLEALDEQRELVKIHTIFGGKNPHPHYVVGGMATPLDLNSETAVNTAQLAMISDLIDQAIQFIEQVYMPDLYAMAYYYKDWLYGGGIQNYLCYGDFPERSVFDRKSFWFPSGVIVDGNLHDVKPVDPWNESEIEEFVNHSWYTYNGGEEAGKHPWQGETIFNFTGPKPPFDTLDTENKYSWIKTPRWKEQPMEVGPLARMMMGYATNHRDIKPAMEESLRRAGLPLSALHSALGRTFARGIETRVLGQHLRKMMDEFIANIKSGDQVTFNPEKWDPANWPKEAKGVGIVEAPRGALAHWSIIQDGTIKNWQAIVPTTWNAAPRDKKGTQGAYEASLMNVPVHDPKQPLEILRIIHSFDPCLACAVHLTDLENNETLSIKIE